MLSSGAVEDLLQLLAVTLTAGGDASQQWHTQACLEWLLSDG